MFTTFLLVGAALNFSSGNLICGSICLGAVGLRLFAAK